MIEKLAITSDHLVAFLDVLSCGGALVDAAGTIVSCNARFADMIQQSPQELHGRQFSSLCEFMAPDRESESCDSESVEHEAALILPDATRLPVIVSSRALPASWGMPDHRVVTVMDISKQKSAEQLVREQYEAVVRVSDGLLGSAMTFRTETHELTDKLAAANLDAVHMLAVASELKDADTGVHIRRIQYGTEALALAIGIAPDDAKEMGVAAVLHDVGKLLVPDEVLKKPSELTPEERSTIELHTVVGENLMPNKPFFRLARKIARSHHENWDGSGYPDKLAGEEIPLPARIVHLVDVFDALTHERVYKEAQSPDAAMKDLQAAIGTHFDPQLVEVFTHLHEAGVLEAIRREIERAAAADDWSLVDVAKHVKPIRNLAE